MSTFLHAFDVGLSLLRTVFLAGAVGLAGICGIEWGVRSRRLQPFSPMTRSARRLLSPLMKPVERRVVRAGGTPASAPWWTLIGAIVLGIVVLQALEFARGQMATAYLAFSSGPRGVIHMLLRWTFAVLYIALLARVIATWVRLNPFGRFVRWSFTLTEPILRPLRSALPTFGMIDFSPLVAYFILRVIEYLLLSLV